MCDLLAYSEKPLRQRLAQDEQGLTLVIAVMILISLTLIGMGAVTSSNIAMDVSGNLKARAVAFHAAEACMYYQIKRINDSGSSTTALSSFSLGNGVTCSATQPVPGGGLTGASVLDGYSLEEGAESVAYASYSFTVTGNGPRGTVSTMEVDINLPAPGGGY